MELSCLAQSARLLLWAGGIVAAVNLLAPISKYYADRNFCIDTYYSKFSEGQRLAGERKADLYASAYAECFNDRLNGSF